MAKIKKSYIGFKMAKDVKERLREDANYLDRTMTELITQRIIYHPILNTKINEIKEIMLDETLIEIGKLKNKVLKIILN